MQETRAAPEPGPARESLLSAVARELTSATAALPERHREALALRERRALSYQQMSAVMGIGAPAVPLLLARARLRLRDQLRGVAAISAPPCDERERALRLLAIRQDAEPIVEADAEWLIEHLGECDSCSRAHAAMLEASVCYRAATVEERPG
jgi:Sigma-70, region 4